MELYQIVEELGEANQEFLLRYNWEWFCTLNLQSGSDYPMAESKLKDWRINMGSKTIFKSITWGFTTLSPNRIYIW
jgi:hypothetical protein